MAISVMVVANHLPACMHIKGRRGETECTGIRKGWCYWLMTEFRAPELSCDPRAHCWVGHDELHGEGESDAVEAPACDAGRDVVYGLHVEATHYKRPQVGAVPACHRRGVAAGGGGEVLGRAVEVGMAGSMYCSTEA